MRRINKDLAEAMHVKPIAPVVPVADGVSSDLESRILEDVKAGRVYTVKDIQNRLRISYEKARQLCTKEPGILRAGDTRVPHCVFENIVRRLVMPSSEHAA